MNFVLSSQRCDSSETTRTWTPASIFFHHHSCQKSSTPFGSWKRGVKKKRLSDNLNNFFDTFSSQWWSHSGSTLSNCLNMFEFWNKHCKIREWCPVSLFIVRLYCNCQEWRVSMSLSLSLTLSLSFAKSKLWEHPWAPSQQMYYSSASIQRL